MRSRMVLTAPGSRPTATAAGVSVSRILTGKPSAKMFSAGAARLSRASATSARSSTATIGPAICSAARNIIRERRDQRRAASVSIGSAPPQRQALVGRAEAAAHSRWPPLVNSSVMASSWCSRPNDAFCCRWPAGRRPAQREAAGDVDQVAGRLDGREQQLGDEAEGGADRPPGSARPGSPGSTVGAGAGRSRRGPTADATARAKRDLDRPGIAPGVERRGDDEPGRRPGSATSSTASTCSIGTWNDIGAGSVGRAARAAGRTGRG